MGIRNIFSSLVGYLHQVSIQAVGGIVAALFTGLLGVLGIGFYAGYSVKGTDDKQKQIIEVVTRNDLRRAIEEAKTRLIATGYVMSDIDANLISEKPPNFYAVLVFVDPLGAGKTNSVICQRQRDEEGESTPFDDYEGIISKIKQFRSPRKTGSLVGSRLKLGVIDLYPTMTVMMVDNDLYAYFYPYGEAANSPVVKFTDYWNGKEKDRRGRFFDDHLNRITQYREKVSGSKTKFLLTDPDFDRYSKPAPNPCS